MLEGGETRGHSARGSGKWQLNARPKYVATSYFDSADGDVDGEWYDHLVLRAATDNTWV